MAPAKNSNHKQRFAFVLLCTSFLLSCTRIPEDVFSGYAEAELIYVSAPIAGVIQKISVARGVTVQKGDELFVLDAEPEALQRAEAAARLAQAQAQSADVSKARRPQEIETVEQQLVQAKAARVASQAAVTRQTDLVNKGFASASQLDDLRAALDRDNARVAELQAQLALARSPSRADTIAAAQAEVQAARAALAATQWREGQQRQNAPASGVVFDVSYRPGERVGINAPVVALLPLPQEGSTREAGGLKLRFYVSAAQLPRLKLGQEVDVGCEACPTGLHAKVNFIAPQAEYTPPVIYSNESRSKLVFMVQAQPDAQTAAVLKPGQPIDVRISPR